MMIALGVALLYGLIGLAILAALIYVIVKRLEDRDKENFEKRDN